MHACIVFLFLLQGKISDVDIQRLAIETGERFTLDEVREMIEAADQDGTEQIPVPLYWSMHETQYNIWIVSAHMRVEC